MKDKLIVGHHYLIDYISELRGEHNILEGKILEHSINCILILFHNDSIPRWIHNESFTDNEVMGKYKVIEELDNKKKRKIGFIS